MIRVIKEKNDPEGYDTEEKSSVQYIRWGFPSLSNHAVEEMFRDFKLGGYNLEITQVTGERLIALILLLIINCDRAKTPFDTLPEDLR